jgi:hypothetical protein
MLRRGVREADMDRLAEEAALLKRPTWEEAQELIARRLDAQPETAAARRLHQGRLWPLPAAPLRDLVENRDGTPRRLIAWCKAEFERLQTGQATPPPPLEVFLQQEFDRTQREVVSDWNEAATEGALTHGLPLAWAAGGWGETMAADGLEEVDLLLEGPMRATPISVCNGSANRLTNRLERLRRQIEQGELDNLVLVRDADRPFSATAIKAQDHLQALQHAGAVLVRPSREALQQLEAMRRLVSAALAGDLANAGETVAGPQVQAWFAARLPTALRSFLGEAARQNESRGPAPTPAARV